MFHKEIIPLNKANQFDKLVLDYFSGDEKVKKFYSHFPDLNGFSEFVNQNPYKNFDRNALVEILVGQQKLARNTSEETLANVEKLKNENCYTVVTGHQLCLFTGPLYFIYKLFSAINLCEELKEKFPAQEFVPIYWMASEDHDFEEVNHIHLFGKKIVWNTSQGGAVGDFELPGLQEVLEQLKSIWGEGNNALKLSSLFENAYLKHKNLSDATRFLVNEIFGKYGLVVVDGNDREFKKQFRDIFRDDVFENNAYKKVTESITELSSLGYDIQVNPREINLFLLEAQSRHRIEKENNDFVLSGKGKKISDEEIKNILEHHPEKLSPNVVLRPLYQQRILPNIAYVGGPGELAYWLEFKGMFDLYKIVFPILVPRNFVLIVEKSLSAKLEKLNLHPIDFFEEESEVIKLFLQKNNRIFVTDEEKEILNTVFISLENKIQNVDASLVNLVRAESAKAQSILKAIEDKGSKALKLKSDTALTQIKNIKQKLFPQNSPQERVENFSSYYLKSGDSFFDEIKNQIRGLDINLKILIEK